MSTPPISSQEAKGTHKKPSGTLLDPLTLSHLSLVAVTEKDAFWALGHLGSMCCILVPISVPRQSTNQPFCGMQ